MNGGPAPETSASLDAVARFEGDPAAFWNLLLSHMARLADARAGAILVRRDDGEWAEIAAWPSSGPDAEPGPREALRRAGAALAEAAATPGSAARDMAVEGFRAGGTVLAVRLPADDAVALACLRTAARVAPADANRLLPLLRHAASLAAAYQARRRAAAASADAARFGAALDLLGQLRRHRRFVAAAMALCNEIAGRYGCARVALGWRRGDYIRLTAVSHAESFEKRMDAVRRIETAMEEAFDQDEEILWPAPAESFAIAREHEALAREQGAANVASIPVRRDGRPLGVLLCERDRPFGEADLGHLRLIADHAGPLLGDLHDRDRWFGARVAAVVARWLVRAAEPRQVGVKLAAIAAAAAVAVVIAARAPFRVDAPFVMRADLAVVMPAPFDGYLAEVAAEPGDRVPPGRVLLRLDTRELLLEEAAAAADRERYLREAEKARAENSLAAMRIAAALAEQARVRLELTRHRLSQAALAAPFDGVVIEGDLRERLGAPVRQGDALMRLARLDSLAAELEIDQRDLHEVAPGARVRLAFAGRPAMPVSGVVERIEPLAQPRDRRNVFLARCRLDAAPADWMRPGMTGLAKIDAGRRSPAWIATRRTVDFLRLHLWW